MSTNVLRTWNRVICVRPLRPKSKHTVSFGILNETSGARYSLPNNSGAVVEHFFISCHRLIDKNIFRKFSYPYEPEGGAFAWRFNSSGWGEIFKSWKQYCRTWIRSPCALSYALAVRLYITVSLNICTLFRNTSILNTFYDRAMCSVHNIRCLCIVTSVSNGYVNSIHILRNAAVSGVLSSEIFL